MLQRELAVKTGISVSFLSELERGSSDCRADRWLDIARALDVTLQWLLTGREWTGSWLARDKACQIEKQPSKSHESQPPSPRARLPRRPAIG